ncbi:MAG TPA: A/G-specific adenine glycosylase [Steroidobacteraceae bacterium]
MDRQPIAARLLDWHVHAGRHDLPWQQQRTAYRVWISEIMLQQTQVATVIPYFERFMRKIPDVRALANAPIDEVLHLWTGLGYYARARNLHRAAQVIRDRHGGEFPTDFQSVVDLPGIGRSTAGAILAQAQGTRHAILDGNVKRVLSRHYGIDGPPDEAATLALLWQRAEENTPTNDLANYTQAIMDLGATLCARKPRCAECPIAGDCVAHIESRQDQLPAPKKRRAERRQRRAVMLVARHASRVLLVQRPPNGIWGGLWCLPEFDSESAAEQFASTQFARLPGSAALPDIEHSFTHFDLVITPLVVRCHGARRVNEVTELWYDLARPARVGLPAPIKTLLGNLAERMES